MEAEAVRRFIAAETGEAVEITRMEELSGGAIQENWLLDATIGGTPRKMVLRKDAPSSLDQSHGRVEEYRLFRAAHAAGVAVPEPLWLGRQVDGIDGPFFLMERVAGAANPRKITRMEREDDRHALAYRLGEELARIHSITPGHAELEFLQAPEPSPALARVNEFRARLDESGRPQPVIEWGVRWLELNAPGAPDGLVLCHNDYRTGNYMVEGARLTGILDWEFAGWSDRHEDIGWFCAKCWRFGQPWEAGGVGPRDAFYEGYESVAGAVIDRGVVDYWSVLATVRWAVIAVGQGDRYLSGEEENLELALTRHVVPELEIDILNQTGAIHA